MVVTIAKGRKTGGQKQMGPKKKRDYYNTCTERPKGEKSAVNESNEKGNNPQWLYFCTQKR